MTLNVAKNVEKALIYLDQNVISSISSGQLTVTPEAEQLLVYSDEHFREIRRSQDPLKSIETLQRIEARMLNLQMDASFKLTGLAYVSEETSVESNYNQYCHNVGEVNYDEAMMDPLVAWLNGGGDQDSLGSMPSKIAKQIDDILGEFGFEELKARADDVAKEFSDSVDTMIEGGNNIEETRKALGFQRGAAGNLEPESALSRIWEVIGPICGEISSGQFFGFEPHSWEDDTTKTLFSGIVSCCAILDIVGYQAEKKVRKISKVPNVRSDASHIGMGAFCAAILSQDIRLINRAKAIYSYKNIGTSPILINIG